MEIVSALPWWIWPIAILLLIGIKDVFFNSKHTIKHNFPVVGHIRYLLEKIGPEMRQYIVANNREELPFNRSERSWIYASSKRENNYEGFGTDKDIHSPNFHFIKPQMFPFRVQAGHPNESDPDFLPVAKVIGAHHNRKKPFRPKSAINIGAMSYGSLSAKAVEAMNVGSLKSGCIHNTGEGGLSMYHSNGADVIFQIGTGYFGVRDEDGNFSFDKAEKIAENNPFVKAFEIKLSQGAKPGKGGVLPASKISAEIAEIRHIPKGQAALSPHYHSAFSNVDELLAFIEELSKRTGLPVGIKSAVGKLDYWHELAKKMKERNVGPDYIAIDGGEGGTGAAPPSFADHVSLPFFYAFSSVYRVFQEYNMEKNIVWVGSGKLGLPAKAIKAMALGVDMIYVAREAMMSIGCIQAQVCHTNRCPAGVATQNKWLQNGIHVPEKSDRLAQYMKTYRKEVIELTHAAGYEHPCEFNTCDIDISMGDSNTTQTMEKCFGYTKTPVEFSGMRSYWEEHHGGD